jgi:hypothetical protein
VLVHEGRIYHVDNDQSFENSGDSPFYAKADHSRGGVAPDMLHMDASSWLQGLNSKKLVLMASGHGILRGEIAGMVGRLRQIQEMHKAGHTIGQMAEKIEDTRMAA